jgi:hypothetical protein
MMVYHEKISPPGPLSVLASEPSDVVLSQRTIESLEQENAWLKERLARIIRSQIAKEPLSNVTFSQWVDGGAGFSSLIEVPAVLRPSARRLSPPRSSCGRECPAGKE